MRQKIEMYLVGRYVSGEFPNIVWEFRGIFNTKRKALDACKRKEDFYTTVHLNEEVGPETRVFPTYAYPVKKEKKGKKMEVKDGT